MNQCVVFGCPKRIPPMKLMCVPHWSAVPRELKLHIWVLCETGFARRGTPWQAAVQAAAREAMKFSDVPSSGSPVGG